MVNLIVANVIGVKGAFVRVAFVGCCQKFCVEALGEERLA